MCKSVIFVVSKVGVDIKLKEGDKLIFGKYEFEVRSISGYINGKIYGVGDYMGMIYLRKDFFCIIFLSFKIYF